MYRHTIPSNINDNGMLFGGMLKKRNTIEAGTVLIGMFLLVRIAVSFGLPLLISCVVYVALGIFPAVLCLIGLGDQSVTEAIGTSLKYNKMPDILEYKLPEGSIEEKPVRMGLIARKKKEAEEKDVNEKNQTETKTKKTNKHKKGRKKWNSTKK